MKKRAGNLEKETRVASEVDILVIIIHIHTIVLEDCVSFEIVGLSCTAEAIVSVNYCSGLFFWQHG